jgi:hypothetical protein
MRYFSDLAIWIWRLIAVFLAIHLIDSCFSGKRLKNGRNMLTDSVASRLAANPKKSHNFNSILAECGSEIIQKFLTAMGPALEDGSACMARTISLADRFHLGLRRLQAQRFLMALRSRAGFSRLLMRRSPERHEARATD